MNDQIIYFEPPSSIQNLLLSVGTTPYQVNTQYITSPSGVITNVTTNTIHITNITGPLNGLPTIRGATGAFGSSVCTFDTTSAPDVVQTSSNSFTLSTTSLPNYFDITNYIGSGPEGFYLSFNAPLSTASTQVNIFGNPGIFQLFFGDASAGTFKYAVDYGSKQSIGTYSTSDFIQVLCNNSTITIYKNNAVVATVSKTDMNSSYVRFQQNTLSVVATYSNIYWLPVSIGQQPSVSVSDQQIIFSASGSSTGSSGLLYNYNSNVLTTNSITTGDLIVGNATIHIGTGAGQTSQTANCVAIGRNAGNSNQGNGLASSIAIGYGAGQTNQNYNSVAIGESAGASSQGFQSVSIGPSAGSISQGSQSVAIGYQAGQNSQSTNAIAIGMAGKNSQSVYSVAIGISAGQQSLGTNSIAIGFKAAESTGVANSIVLNSSGNALNATTSGLFVNPVRVQNGIPTGVLGYNSSTSEIAVTNVLPNMSFTGTTQVYGNLGLNGYQIQNPVLKGVNEYVYSATGTSTVVINCSTGNNFNITLGANTTFSFTNWPATNTLQSVNLFLTQPSSGGPYTGAFTGVSFGDQSSYVSFSTGANKTDVYSFFSYNNGGKILGFLSGKGF